MKTISRSNGPRTPRFPVFPAQNVKHPVQPKLTYSPLRVYTEEEFAFLIQQDPSFMAIDAKNYDPAYVRTMCEIYCLIAENTMEPLTKIAHFEIANLEKALKKLSKEHPDGYKNLCQLYGIDPAKHRSKNRHAMPSAKHAELLYLCNWGYVEQFLPNFIDITEKIAKKMFSKEEMSNIEKTKYAHLFFLLIYTFDLMPYDLSRYYEFVLEAKKEDTKLSSQIKLNFLHQAMCEMHQKEAESLYVAVMLNNAYQALFERLPDNSISVDMIRIFLDDILGTVDSLRIKEFFNLLSEEEASKFRYLNLQRLQYNFDFRELKERIFCHGGWYTDIGLFLTNPKEEFLKSIEAAWRKFEKSGYVFGKGVEPLKKPLTFTQVMSGKTCTYEGYLYSKSPKRVRISDVDELWMICYYLKNL